MADPTERSKRALNFAQSAMVPDDYTRLLAIFSGQDEGDAPSDDPEYATDVRPRYDTHGRRLPSYRPPSAAQAADFYRRFPNAQLLRSL